MRIGLLLGALALGMAMAPANASASAKPGFIRLPPSFSFSLQLPRVDGYRLAVSTAGHAEILISAIKGRTSATYSTHGFVNRRRLHADLGRFGRIDVRFHQVASSGPIRPFEKCRGRSPWQLRGLATGKIRFRGLGGFVAIDKRRAKATVLRTFEQICKEEPGTFYAVAETKRQDRRIPASPKGLEPKVDTLSAKRRRDGKTIEFEASNILLPGLTIGSMRANTSQRIDGVQVDNSASVSTPAGGNEISITHRGVHPAKAKVLGISPFSGESAYEPLAGGGSSWSGSLRATLPGESAIDLSGPGFQAEICHQTLAGVLGCSSQPSGSQAQSLFNARLSWSR